jgi:nitroimidazol reductase NimA-like FMN-containing flavoprotein (pyridoxamine 5'-phosphate oxidase superfamily)
MTDPSASSASADLSGPAGSPGALPASGRTQVRRHRDRAGYEIDQINAILDEGFICHVAGHDAGTTWMIPTAYARRDDQLLLHGAAANHLLSAGAAGAQLVATVTLVDGMVLSRSTFSHSINYRSVVVFGHATEITDPAQKAAALECIVEHMLPGRTAEARPPTDTELRSTIVLALPITEASAKSRSGPPADGDGPDGELPVWAGTIDLRTVAGLPVASPDLGAGGATAGPSSSWAVQPGRW